VSRYVVDASVALKWYLPEPESELAGRLLDPEHDLIAPDLLFAEVGNALWKRWRRGEIGLGELRDPLAALAAVPFDVRSAAPLLSAAAEVAVVSGCTVYDGLYVALAIETGAPLITADRGLARRLAGGPWARSVRTLAELE